MVSFALILLNQDSSRQSRYVCDYHNLGKNWLGEIDFTLYHERWISIKFLYFTYTFRISWNNHTSLY